MMAYGITYSLNGRNFETIVDARNIDSAKKKIARKHNVSDARDIVFSQILVLGYF